MPIPVRKVSEVTGQGGEVNRLRENMPGASGQAAPEPQEEPIDPKQLNSLNKSVRAKSIKELIRWIRAAQANNMNLHAFMRFAVRELTIRTEGGHRVPEGAQTELD